MGFIKKIRKSWGLVPLVVTLVMLAWVAVPLARGTTTTVASTADSVPSPLEQAMPQAQGVQSGEPGVWTRYSGNPVLSPSQSWEGSAVWAPYITKDGSTFKIWYTGGWPSRIGYATSSDGITWTKLAANPVLSAGNPGDWDEEIVAQPYVLKSDGGYQMWFLGTMFGWTTPRIGYATSPDGVTWTKYGGNPVLDLGAPGSWEEIEVAVPWVLYDNGTYKMWYTGQDIAGHYAIGYATSSDGINWTKYSGNPVLSGDMGTWDETGLLGGSVLFDGAVYRMWYFGKDSSGIDRIGYATSPDGINWTKYSGNPVLDLGGSGAWDDYKVHYPRVILDGGVYKMWYSGEDGEGGCRFGYATAPEMPFASTCTVTSTLDSGAGTLRECLENALSGQTITFDPAIFLPDTPATIALTNPLPVITQGNLTIDGTSAGVIIDGSGIAEDANCLLLASNGNTVRGLRIGECAWCGVSVSGADNTVADNVLFSSAGAGVALWGTDTYSNIVTGNYIGTDAEGTAGLGNGTGVWISYGAHDNIVGGYTPAERNVISNNGGSGVAISRSGTDGNLVVGNYIGTNPAGTAGLGNVFDGVWIGEGAQYNTIEGNIISANGANGVVIGGAGSDGNAIVGNLIGLAADGATPLGSSASGVDIRNGAQGNTVGGDTPGERNVISGNGRGGVVVENGGTENNMITGNYIGTDVSGTVALGNGAGAGVHIKDGTKSNVVGGDTPEERNIICGNETGVWITGSGTTNNIVSGNYIGTDVSGTASLRNNGPGVDIREGAQNNTIGGTTAGERNVISGKNYYGVVIEDSGTDFNTVSGNYIGTDATGTTALGNMNDGVGISGAKSNIIERNLISSNDLSGVCISGSDTMSNVVSDNLIGTDASGTADLGNGSHGVALFDGAQQNVIGEGNVIAYNKGHGIGVWNPTTLYNTITRNSIHSNTGMGIDNANGGNTELPPLVITEAVGMTVSGTACAGCTLEFFSDDENEGRVFEGSTIAEGDGTFTFSRTESFTGPNVTATATDADGNTSEFSAPVSVPVLIIEPDVGTYGTKFDTTGSGWAPVEVVTVEWFWPDGSLVTSRDYTADAYGNINPSDWVAGVGEPAGTYACTATGPTSGSVTKTFEVLPATEPLLAVWPDSGVVGETFYICGSGFQSSENITLTFTGPTTATLNLTADEEGNLFYIEWDSTGYLWGTYTLEAVGDQGSTTSATFEILPIQIYLPLVTKNYQ